MDQYDLELALAASQSMFDITMMESQITVFDCLCILEEIGW